MEFKYDLAISLCKRDVEFARQLCLSLNPSLKVFFYENRQEEILTQSGPEVFGKVFREKSRLVIVLSRPEWSETYYTEIEKHSIIDRTSKEGYRFLVIIPMERNAVPAWYPTTLIYIDPYKFTIDQIARFIEFKVVEEGGVLKPIALEDRHAQLKDRIIQKQKLISLQETELATKSAVKEVANLKKIFSAKREVLQDNLFAGFSYTPFGDHIPHSYFQLGKFRLDCEVSDPTQQLKRAVTAQDFRLTLILSKVNERDHPVTIESGTYIYYYTDTLKGWSIPYLSHQATENELMILFRDRSRTNFYDLKKPTISNELIDEWFQKLLKVSSEDLERYL